MEFIEVKKEEEMELEGIIIRPIIEKGKTKSLFLKDANGKSYKINGEYSELSILKPKPIIVNRHVLIVSLNKDIKREFEFDTIEEAESKQRELERKYPNDSLSFEIVDKKVETNTVIDEAI